MPDNSAAIAAIDKKIQTGVASVSTDGNSASFDLEALRRERARLVETHTGSGARPNRKFGIFQIDLSGG